MNMDLVPLLTSFLIIFLSELGDKTQICTIMLSSRSSAYSVFLGTMSAFFIIDGLSALLGGELLGFLPQTVISIISGVIFMIFGIIPFIYRRERRSFIFENNKASFIKIFLLVALMELGDKTQVMSITLAAQFRNPLLVFFGIMLAFSLITAISVILGCKLLKFIPEKYLTIGTSMLFLLLGLILILEAIFNFSIIF